MQADRPLSDSLHRQVVEALTMLVEEKCDYMRRNHLGDPEREHATKAGRAALAALSEPAAQVQAVDVEAMLVACVPGGSICDPQQVADAIRSYFAAAPQGEPTDDATKEQARDAVKRMNKARNFPSGTDACSRHVALMAETLAKGQPYPMLDEEREHCAISLAITVAMLWEGRSILATAPPAQGGEAVAMWQCRNWNRGEGGEPVGWGEWSEVKGSRMQTVEQRVAELRDYIAQGYKYQLRALYASPVQTAVQGVAEHGESYRHLAALVAEAEKEKQSAVAAAYEEAALVVEKRLVIHPKRSAIAKEIRAAALHQAHQKEGA